MTPEEIILLQEASELNSRRNRFLYEGGSDPLVEMTVSEWWTSIPERDEPSPISGELEVKGNRFMLTQEGS